MLQLSDNLKIKTKTLKNKITAMRGSSEFLGFILDRNDSLILSPARKNGKMFTYSPVGVERKFGITPKNQRAILRILKDDYHCLSYEFSPYDGIDEKLTPESYLHTWICDRCSIEIKKSKKVYVATITWGSSAFETSFWTYPCTFDKKTTSLVCKGGAVHKDVTYSDDGKEKTKIIYKDGSGSFKIVSGTLRWTDDKENSGDGMCFVESQMD